MCSEYGHGAPMHGDIGTYPWEPDRTEIENPGVRQRVFTEQSDAETVHPGDGLTIGVGTGNLFEVFEPEPVDFLDNEKIGIGVLDEPNNIVIVNIFYHDIHHHCPDLRGIMNCSG